jgi:hypothetical protein
VLPLDHRLIEAMLDPRRAAPERPAQVFYPNGSIVPENRVLQLRGRRHKVDAYVEVPADGAQGVLVAMGTVLGGWSLHMLDGHLRYVHNFVGAHLDIVASPERIPSGPHVLGFVMEPSGTVSLLVDGEAVAESRVERLPISRYNLTGGGLTCGWEQGPAVGPGYKAPFPFTGHIERVVIEAAGGTDPAGSVFADLDALLAEQ